MRYLAVATDFDGIIADDGRPSPAAIAALHRLKSSGHRVILVTGRRLEDLLSVFNQLELFDCVVLENGAVLYDPVARKETLLASPPPREFVERLAELDVAPLDVGQIIVATWLPHHTTVMRIIQEMGLELHVVFNRSAVMVLPAGINKATGLDRALHQLGLSRHEVVGIGDSENDHSLLERCECAVTVANAVPSILNSADFVTAGKNGDGLAELVDELIANDLCRWNLPLSKHRIPIGKHRDGEVVTVAPYGLNILVAGPSGSGKSTVAAGIAERLIEQEYQLCIVDPEGDYGTLPEVISIGNQHHAVTVNEVLTLLADPKVTLNVNLLGIPLADRPSFFGQLLPRLQASRTRTGRPHWIVLDEAHHMIPRDWGHLDSTLPQNLGETLLVTVHPNHIAPDVAKLVDAFIAVGPSPEATVRKFADSIGRPLDWPRGLSNQAGSAVIWFPKTSEAPFPIEIIPGSAERIRHHRKYAEGNMRDRGFFFRGPDNRQNLKAQNLAVFAQMADGIDESTWLFHLRRGDYSRWFRDSVKDNSLADEAERIEKREDLLPEETRRLIRSLIESRYTLPE
ncbi:MAG: HAD-IIB family hydrolase [Planctomycetaceae bacterium]